MPHLTIEQAFALASEHHAAGRLQEAEQLYRSVLAHVPRHAGAMHYLGLIAHQMKRDDAALELIRGAIVLDPNYAEAHNSLGNVLRRQGQIDHAITAYRRAIELNPTDAEAHANLGVALKNKGQLDEAIASYRHALVLDPNLAETYGNLGIALKNKGRLDEAIAAHRRAVVLQPDRAEAHYNLGNAHREIGQLDEALAAYRQAIDIKPNFAEAHNNIGSALNDLGQFDAAIAAHRQSIALNPGIAEVHHNLSLALLRRGNFEEGWLEHEWRWKVSNLQPPRPFSRPTWTGQDPKGKAILLHPEQGYGDILQFLRYVPLLAARGANIVLEIPPELKALAERLEGVNRLVECGQPLPPFDFHCPILSLPLAFSTTMESIPANVPYLFPDVERLEYWRQRLFASAPEFKIALAWAGNPEHKGDRKRSIPLGDLAPLSHVHGATLYSVQKGPSEKSANNPPGGMRLVNLAPDLRDFADTAAVLCLMDLVITADTCVAHLAGGLGRPVWVMLPFVADWRWFLHRDDSPWYPTMRLFRQTALGDWAGVISRVTEALAALSAARGNS